MSNELITIIVFGGIVLLFALVIILSVCISNACIKKARAKWYKTLATNSDLYALVQLCNKQWDTYDKLSDMARNYQKQIDLLMSGIDYVPSYIADHRRAEAENYKVLYYQTRAEADKWHYDYNHSIKTLDEYCKEHNLQRF